MWWQLVGIVLGIAVLGGYLAHRGLLRCCWGGYVVLYGFAVTGVTAWLGWARLGKSVHFALVFAIALMPVALWGAAVADLVRATDSPGRQRLILLAMLLLIPPLGLASWALERTYGRFGLGVRAVIAVATVTAGWMAANSFWPPFQITLAPSQPPPTLMLLGALLLAMTALGTYLGRHGLGKDPNWSMYPVIYGLGFVAVTACSEWGEWYQPLALNLLSAAVLVAVVLWGMGLAHFGEHGGPGHLVSERSRARPR